MATLMLAQLRRRAGRAVALVLGVLLATTGFTVLTGSTRTSRLTVQGVVSEHARGAYDILVRPAGMRTELEEQRGLVRANFLAGQYGGIAAEQWQRIAALDGVQVAAPIAILGYAFTLTQMAVDVTDLVDPALETQLIRVRFNLAAERDLTRVEYPQTALVYLTKRRLVRSVELPDREEDVRYDDGVYRRSNVCNNHIVAPPYEEQPDGQMLPLCLLGIDGPDVYANEAVLTSRGTFIQNGAETPRLRAYVAMPILMQVAAVDPTAEAGLVGLDRALVAGAYLADKPFGPRDKQASVLVSADPYLDERVAAVAERVAGIPLAGNLGLEALESIRTEPPQLSHIAGGQSMTQFYRDIVVATITGPPREGLYLGELYLGYGIRAGAVEYDVGGDGVLHPRVVVRTAAETLQQHGSSVFVPTIPLLSTEVAQREVSVDSISPFGRINTASPVGVFDRSLLTGGADALAAPLDTYTLATATGADARSRQLLGGQPLAPTSNIGGYLTPSPTALLSLTTLWQAGGAKAAISAVRVRVAGVTGFDDLSRERVRRVAEDIATATGLDVEVMLGASGAAQEVALPAGNFGRPQLRLAELWTRKGVAALIVRAVDRKSVILFGLILAVCLLFVGNAAAAAVRDRRRELALLACLGWSRPRLAGAFLGEVALLGAVAGVLGAVVARPVGHIIDIDISSDRALVAVPVAIGVCLLAAASPARGASRAHPIAAVHHIVSPPGRRGSARLRGVAGMALVNLRRTPGRTGLGALALGVGVAGLTVVTAVAWQFHGTVTGTLLGDAVSVRVRGVDLVATLATVVLGAVAVADVLYLNVRDRAAELATLGATGWSDAAVGRLVAYEGLGIGALGAAGGAGAGLLAASLFVGELSPGLVRACLFAAAVGLAMAVAAIVVPVVLRRRLPMSTLLAEE